MEHTIYGLMDPQTRRFRYVGSSGNPAVRLERHIWDAATDSKGAGTPAKREWLSQLAEEGLEPYLILLARAGSESEARNLERYWIAKFAGEGEPLTNQEAPGGRYTATSLFGSVILEFAAKRGTLGISGISNYIHERTGAHYKQQSVSSYINGRTYPQADFALRFAQSFELDHVEATRLASVYTFQEEPPDSVLEDARRDMEAGKPLPYKQVTTS